MKSIEKKQRKTLGQLFVPICLETLCFMLTGMIDTLMLSSVSDQAVGAVGTANTYISIFIIMFSVISSGMIAVMTQNIGAGKEGVAYQARQVGLLVNVVVGTLLSIFLFACSGMVLEMVGVAPLLMPPAKEYLKIVGGSCILNAMIPIFSSYLRAFGHTKEPLTGTIVGNIANLILNALFLYGFHMGVKGVAFATVISRFLNLLIVVWASHHFVHARKSPERIKNSQVFVQIIKVGLPSALETALYNVALTLIFRFLNQMDSEGFHVTARAYANQITNFSYAAGFALAQANAIITGWSIGEKDYEKCYKSTKKAALRGIGIAIVLESIFALTSPWIMKLFSDDPEMIRIVGILLAIDIVLEVGRVSNLVFGTALKTSGDAIFTTVIAAVFMYVFAVGGTYFLGLGMELFVVGAYIGLTLDECVRAMCMFLRWQSGIWKEKVLVIHEEA